jgi:deazaflavin-dependent oxidoreductase (nitroreductase family)
VSDWNTQVIEEFRANGGRVPRYFAPDNVLLLHHTGAHSGVVRVSPLVYLPDGDRLVVTASAGGRPHNPGWYHNLRANPRATVDVGTETFDVDAVEITGAERDVLWQRITATFVPFAGYEGKTSRTIPLMALRRAG